MLKQISISVLIILFFVFQENIFSQKIFASKDVIKWLVTKPPEPGTHSWQKANYSVYEWQVLIQNGNVIARNIASEGKIISGAIPDFVKQSNKGKKDQCFFKLKDGWLIGNDGGEFGGSLWYFSADGKKSHKISSDRVKAFYNTSAGILAIVGLSHLSISEGKLIQISLGSDEKWKVKTFIDLKASPEVAVLGKDGSLLVATTDKLIRINMNKVIKVLLNNAFWTGLYPNSIIVSDSGDIYIGMRHGILRISQNSNIDWLIPDKSFL